MSVASSLTLDVLHLLTHSLAIEYSEASTHMLHKSKPASTSNIQTAAAHVDTGMPRSPS